MKKNIKLSLGVLGLLGMFSTGLNAATETSSFNVNVNVVAACTIDAITDMNFGTFGDGQNTDSTTTTDITVNCPASVPFSIKLDGGSSGSDVARTMKNGTDTLAYTLSSDTAGTNWDGTTGVSGTGTQTKTVHGKIIAGETTSGGVLGVYSDTINVSVVY